MATHTERFTDMNQTSNLRTVLMALLVGGLVGAGTMLFLAPQSGKKLRANLAQKTHELRDRTTDTVKEAVSQVKSKGLHLKDGVRDRAEDLQHQGVDILAEQLDRIAAAAEAGKKALKSSR
ncbi:MAG TPA: YtxH domain-containing protein [Anaerolineales bacterium]|nr:YtxH domain-containing protein [Anaerolineales bacterium]